MSMAALEVRLKEMAAKAGIGASELKPGSPDVLRRRGRIRVYFHRPPCPSSVCASLRREVFHFIAP
jgi:hypothetical protein